MLLTSHVDDCPLGIISLHLIKESCFVSFIETSWREFSVHLAFVFVNVKIVSRAIVLNCVLFENGWITTLLCWELREDLLWWNTDLRLVGHEDLSLINYLALSFNVSCALMNILKLFHHLIWFLLACVDWNRTFSFAFHRHELAAFLVLNSIWTLRTRRELWVSHAVGDDRQVWSRLLLLIHKRLTAVLLMILVHHLPLMRVASLLDRCLGKGHV